jgi:hypothetical protein
MGLAGLLSLGSANFAVHLMVLGPLAIGPLGAYVETRRFGSPRGRLIAAVLYATLPVPYNSLSQGHWAGLIGYAAAPWLVGGICRLAGQSPYPFLHWDGAWPRFVALGLGLAVAGSFAPAMLLVVPVAGLALAAGSLLTGRDLGGARLLVASLITAAVGFVALVPWSFSALRSWSALIGSPAGALHPLGLGQAIRMQTGPYGGGALGWALVVAAAISLCIGRSWRLAWAGRLWVVALTFIVVAWAGSRGWFPVPPLELLLAPAGAALVFAVALGAASVESDLSGYRFGWRQFAPAFGALAALAAALPFVSWVGNGQWQLPPSGADASYPFPAASQAGDYRVLWVGDPGSLPLGAQGTSQGVSFATSLDGLPTVSQLWPSSGASAAASVARDLTWVDDNQTTSLGHLLAPLSVRYVVVPVSGGASDAVARLTGALNRQVDLFQVGIDRSYEVYANSGWVPLFSVLAGTINFQEVTGPFASAPAGTGAAGTETAGTGAAGTGAAGTGAGGTGAGGTGAGGTGAGGGVASEPAGWAAAVQLQKLDLRSTQALALGTSGLGEISVTASSPLVLYGGVPDGSWHVAVNGRAVGGLAAVGGATAWQLPTGRDAVVVSRSLSGGQYAANVVMALFWAVALLAALARLQIRLGSQLTMAGFDLAAGRDVSEIDWSAITEGPDGG